MSPASFASVISSISRHICLLISSAWIAAGCTGYLEKPINPDTFMDQVESYL